jgi:hypothetical protein
VPQTKYCDVEKEKRVNPHIGGWFCKIVSMWSGTMNTVRALKFLLEIFWVFMLLAVVILKSLIELSLMFIVGRFLLGLLAGAKRQTNVFWQLLDVAAKPALWLTRRISPKLILDQHIPLAAASWLIIAWVLVVMAKVDLCLQAGGAACQ